MKIKFKLISTLLFLILCNMVFAEETWPEFRFKKSDRYWPILSNSKAKDVEWAEVEQTQPRSSRSSYPCNFVVVGVATDCYWRENDFMQLYFDKHVPAKLRALGKNVAQYQREQKRFERRVKQACIREIEPCDSLGSGCGMMHGECRYRHYHPRYLKFKRMLGEPHPVRRRVKP